MAAKKKTEGATHLSDAGTSSKDARLKAEAERQAQASADRAALVAELKADHTATAKRLKAKPTDTRNVGG